MKTPPDGPFGKVVGDLQLGPRVLEGHGLVNFSASVLFFPCANSFAGRDWWIGPMGQFCSLFWSQGNHTKGGHLHFHLVVKIS